MDKEELLGRFVISKAGRDKNKLFIIVNVLDDEYVYVCDGEFRKIENPKKKKIKHLIFTNCFGEDIKSRLISEKEITNSQLRKVIYSMNESKEV